jgi:hypothetical protein
MKVMHNTMINITKNKLEAKLVMRLKHLFLILFAAGSISVYGQEGQAASDNLSLRLYFRIGKTTLEPSFRGNGQSMKNFSDKVKAIFQDTNYVVTNLRITSAASPDGFSESWNIHLAKARAESMIRYITSHVKIPASIIAVDNKGENWEALYDMVESSKEIPCKMEVLYILSNEKDRNRRMNKLKSLQNGIAYQYMYKYFFPDLRSGIWGTSKEKTLNITEAKKWRILRPLLVTSDIVNRKELLQTLDSIADPQERICQLKAHNGGKTYDYLVSKTISGLLHISNIQCSENWKKLKLLIDSSETPDKVEVLRIIEQVPITEGREDRLKSLNSGKSYDYIKKNLFMKLMQDSIVVNSVTISFASPQKNWERLRSLIAASSMEGKEKIIAIIDENADLPNRIKALIQYDDGHTYQYLCDIFLPMILYDISLESIEIWKEMEEVAAVSDLENKEQVMEIFRTVPLSMGAEEQLKALDGGKTYHLLQDKLFIKVLITNPSDNQGGTGMSLSYTLKPEARERINASNQLTEWRRAYETRSAAFSKAKNTEIQQPVKIPVYPVFAIHTNLLSWVGVNSSLDHFFSTPNVALEYYISKRWSVFAEGILLKHDLNNADHEVWSHSSISLEPRIWLNGNGFHKGFYVGTYALDGDFNVKLNSLSKTNGYTGSYYEGGLSIGYQVPIVAGFGLEIGVRGGYRLSDYDTYFVRNNHHYAIDRSLSKSEFDLTGIRLSLNYRIGKASKKTSHEK